MGQKRIAPGRSTQIKASFSSGSYRRRVTKYVYVTSNDPDESTIKLTITGIVKVGASISVLPANVNLGLIWVKNKFKDTLIIKNIGEADLVIDEIKMLRKSNMTVRLVSDRVIPPNTTGKIEISYESNTLFGTKRIEIIEDYIVIRSNDVARPESWIPVRGYITDDPWFAILYAKILK